MGGVKSWRRWLGLGEEEAGVPGGEPSALEGRLGYRFRRPELLERALTHRSHANEQGLDANYERLEFLGDRVVGLVAAGWLVAEHPGVAEGKLSERLSFLVSRGVLAGIARELGLGDALRLGVGEERSGGREKDSLLADVTEAVLGAIYLDGGLEAAERLLVPRLRNALGERGASRTKDPKTRLQEIVQGRGLELPVYETVSERGPDHSKSFVVECRLAGGAAARGEGPTKKEAERRAAAALIGSLDGSEA